MRSFWCFKDNTTEVDGNESTNHLINHKGFAPPAKTSPQKQLNNGDGKSTNIIAETLWVVVSRVMYRGMAFVMAV